MQRLVYILFLSIYLLEYLNVIGILPRPVTYIPELLSGLLVIILFLTASKQRTFILSTGYWVIFILIAVTMVLGAVLNAAPSGAMFAGLRGYFKFIPFFFLAAIYPFSEEEIKRQFVLLLALSLLQFPVAIYQKFILSAGLVTGDLIGGTVGNSGTLSIYLICAISMTFGFFLKGFLTRWKTIAIMFFLAIPTMINETKATIVMFPIAAFLPVLSMPSGAQKAKAFRISLFLFAGFMLLFVPVYDYFIWDRYGYGLFTFLTMEGRLIGYLAPHSSGHDIHDIGRFDQMALFFKAFSDDPTKILLGLGIGNVSESFLGSKFSGEYLLEYGRLAGSSLSLILIETGLIGLLLILVLLFKLFRDALLIGTRADFSGGIALGWTGVILLMVFGLFYSELIPYNTISYLFWYISGYIAVTASRMKIQARIQGPDLMHIKINPHRRSD